MVSSRSLGARGLSLPLFDYRCKNGHTVEVLLRAGERGPGRCGACGERLRRVVAAPAPAKVRGGRRRRDVRYRGKGSKVNLLREGGA